MGPRITYASHPFLLLTSLKRVAKGCSGKKDTKAIYANMLVNYRTSQVEVTFMQKKHNYISVTLRILVLNSLSSSLLI